MFATLHEVGRRAGVSASTVSRVLNGKREVNEGTRSRVLAVVRRMNYRPGAVGREPGHSRLLGLLMPAEAEQWGLRTNFIQEGLRAMSDVAAEWKYATMVGSYHPALGDKAEDRMIANCEFAGALLFRTGDEMRDSEPFRRNDIPFLIVNRLLPDQRLHHLGVDHRQVGVMAAGHLLECGYRRIGLLLGNTRYVSHRLYLQGFEEAHAAARAAADPALVTEVELNVEGGYAGAQRLMKRRSPPEALVVTGDRAALGCLKALHDMKLKVPRDVGVLAMDGTRDTAFSHPPLTAVEIPWYEMFSLGTRLLIEMIERRPPLEQIAVRYSARLVVRESTRLKHAAA